ncbi:pentapeptide repeat-containing protein [Fischerella sp. PCC 9605]|nr:pentapeptide repeat-containing protein [Fischerella sp. PCC 9605]
MSEVDFTGASFSYSNLSGSGLKNAIFKLDQPERDKNV